MHPPDQPTNSPLSLAEVLRGRRMAILIADAEFIRHAPEGQERDQEAKRTVRETMMLFALRRITHEQRDRILDILSFAIPTFPPDTDVPPDADMHLPPPHAPFP